MDSCGLGLYIVDTFHAQFFRDSKWVAGALHFIFMLKVLTYFVEETLWLMLIYTFIFYFMLLLPLNSDW